MATPSDDIDALSANSANEGTMTRGMAVMGVGISEHRKLFTLAIVFALIYGIMTVADAWVLGWATDEVIRPSFAAGEILYGGMWLGILAFISVAILRVAGVVGRRLIGGLVYYRLIADYRRRVTRKYLELPLAWHQRHPAGQLLSNANADVEAVWSMFMPLPMAIGVIAMLVAALVSMFLADVWLTLIALVIFPLLFILNVFYQRVQSPRMTLAQSLRGSVSAVAHESFDGALVVKSLGREDAETKRFESVSEKLRDANISVGRVRAVFDPALDSLPNIAVLAVIMIGALRVSSGSADPGDVVQIAFLFTVVAFPVRAIGWVLGEVPRSVVGWGRIRSVLDETMRLEYGSEALPSNEAAEINFSKVTFSFHDAPDDPVLHDLDFAVAAKSVTAIVGSTGSGKSTLTSLMTRLVDPQRGHISITVGGRQLDLRELTHANLAELVALVPQSTFIFDDSVRENITLGADITDEEVWQVLDDVQATEFVSALPHGLDTTLGERGTSLSGGQRQRLALARALVRKPAVLVMDDATSALDPEVERRILRRLAQRTAAKTGPTVIVVAYRKATIALADEVLFLSDGQIVDRGTHQDLHERNEQYRAIVDAYDIARADHD